MARRFGVGLSHLQFWLLRACGKRPDRVAWHDRRAGPRSPANRTTPGVERVILAARRALCDYLEAAK